MRFKIVLFFILYCSFLQADILKPAYLEVTQSTDDSYAILLKVPANVDKQGSVKVKEIEGCKGAKEATRKATKKVIGDAHITRDTLTCTEGLKGKSIEVLGLDDAKIELLLRLEFLDKRSQSVLLNASHNSYSIEEEASSVQIIQTYTWLGITHILMGFDHLLFVLLLLFIVKNLRVLFWTITAFTLAHSLTIAGSTLGFVHLPQQPVEAIIALSILFLALEIVYAKQGKVSLTFQYPWLIAFIFGLLHGFGFAGVLAEIGVPEQAITLALIFFNIGVELGQLAFVLLMLISARVFQKLIAQKLMSKLEMFLIYTIGGLASFWMIERILAF